MHIRTDDEVYRVDAVWLGPPRATFPWRARYSSYGVGLLVMIAVMFLQRRLGIPLGFFSVAWALLITVLVTRFVSRRINDERPLLEWLTLFAHELRGPRARTRAVGGALSTGGVRVRRDRPRGTPGPVALPPGSSPAGPARVLGPAGGARRPDVAPAPPVARETTAASRHAAGTRRHRTDADTPATVSAAPTHGARRTPPRAGRKRADAGFGPPSATELGEPVPARRTPDTVDESHAVPTPALPPAPPAAYVAPAMAAWTAPSSAPEPLRVPGRRLDAPARHGDASWGPAPGAFGPGARRRPDPAGPTRPARSSGSARSGDEDDGAPA